MARVVLACIFSCLLASSALAHAAKTNNGKCHAMAYSGGGTKGAYEAGVIRGLVDKLAAEDRTWDVVTGISVGSINAAASALFAVGDEENMADYLIQTWSEIKKSDVYRDWDGGLIEGVLIKPGLYDTSPLRTFLKSRLNTGFKDRKLVVGATSLTTGLFTYWNETQEADHLVESVMASSAIPGIFPPVSLDGQEFCDGGTKLSVNIFDAVTRCLEVVDHPKDMVLDVVLCTGATLPTVSAPEDHTLEVLMRAMEIEKFDKALQLIEDAKLAYPDITFRYLIYPSVALPGQIVPLDFDEKAIQFMIDTGKQDAYDAIAKGVGANFPGPRKQQAAAAPAQQRLYL
eukprot:GILJ01001424.1.p1 GENE.GILJ01001424.1~~GILJ01001424.1.p1  ORF type:complete len:344 (-),score=68.19 GILJ01001424.1:81-1112(-)